jgi:hypothetical protein
MAKKRKIRRLEDNTGPQTQEALSKSKTVLKKRGGPGKKRKYTRANPKHVAYFSEGYDLLQYNMVVRPYVLKKYNVEREEYLDILLYLYPIQFFTRDEYSVLPIMQHHSTFTINRLFQEGYFKKVVQTAENSYSVYTLTDLSHRIVKDYYDYLAARKTISPDCYVTNPFNRVDATKIDKVRGKLLEKLKHQAETKPSLFRKNLFI